MTNDHRIILSSAGQSRRDHMLAELTAVMHGHHRRRRLRRGLGAAAMLAVAAAAAVVSLPGHHPTVETAGNPPATDPTPRAVAIEIVRTEPGIVDRYRAAPPSRAEIISDDQLLSIMASLNRPTGIVRIDGRTMLTAAID